MTSPQKLGPPILISSMLVFGLLAASPQYLAAQSSSGSQNPPAQQEGVTAGDYVIHTSAEIGYRYTNVTGSSDMYDTLVNLQTGPRFLDQTLSMQSLKHQGLLFDNLYMNSSGWGGDPNNYLRLRADKDKWYKLQYGFRRDQNFSDFDLLANPLNPPTSTPSIPALGSPHLFDTTRRMSDIDLTLLPQSRVIFRIGYSRNNMTGPSYSSVHEGTEALLLQSWNTTMNSYRFGVDWKAAPRTVISYDQYFDYYKGDTDYQLAPFAPALLSTGTPVELGLSIDTANKFPCAVPTGQQSLIVGGVLTNDTCSAYFGYSRKQRIRTSTPTERLSLRSNNIQRLDLVASYSYSSAVSSTPMDENFAGLLTRTNTLVFNGTGSGSANRISNVLDAEGTLHITEHLRLIEKFYYWAYRIPENGNFNELDYSCAVPPCTLLSTPLTTPEVPGGTNTLTLSSFNQTWKRNQMELAWDVSKKLGGRVGFRYGNRIFNHFNDYAPGDLDHYDINEFTALFGFWARPVHGLRLNFDFEHTNNDNVIVRIA